MPRKNSSTKAVHGSSIGSNKSNKASSTPQPNTASLPLENNDSPGRGQQDLFSTNGVDRSTLTQTDNLDGPNVTQTASHNLNTLLLGCGAQFDGDMGIDGAKGTAGDAFNIIADDEASPLLCTSINNMTLEDDKINGSQKRMRMKLKVLEREIQGREGN